MQVLKDWKVANIGLLPNRSDSINVVLICLLKAPFIFLVNK